MLYIKLQPAVHYPFRIDSCSLFGYIEDSTMQIVFVVWYILPHENEHNKNTNKNINPKSTGMKTCLTPFCTVKQNLLPLACLGVEGEGSTKKPCNYCVLAQQQRAKSIKDFPLSKLGLPQRKKPSCVNS